MAISTNKIILGTALATIVCIFLFAFVWLNDDNGSTLTEDEDSYHLQRRFAPPGHVEEDKKTLPKMWPATGVDFVFFWTRPLEEDRLGDYELTFRATMTDKDVLPEEASSDFAQWEYYFARGVEHFAPWFRKIIVVVPDNVLSRPFNESDKRVEYIKHSDIMDTDAMPMFDWRALFLNFVSSPYIDGRVSKKFVYADDLTFLLSYLSPSTFINHQGETIIPLVNTSISTPLQDIEGRILKNSLGTVQRAIESVSARLGFSKSEVAEVLTKMSADLPLFESRGLQLIDRQALKDLFAICDGPLQVAKLHKFRQTDSIDPIYMHHVFIYYMRELYKLPSAVKAYASRSDKNQDGVLTREELIALAESLYFENSNVGKWVSDIFELKEFAGKTEVDLKVLLNNTAVVAQMSATAVRPQFRHVLAESHTAALELRRSIPLRLGNVMPLLKVGAVSAIRLGPRILGHEGGNSREAMENLLWNILRNKFTTLETLYKPPPSLGMKIGLAYLCFFFFGAWGFSKWMLRSAKKSID